MSTTIEQQLQGNEEEPLVAAPDTKTLFLARRTELRLVVDPIYTEYGPQGQRRGNTKGRTIEFMDGSLKTDDPETIEFLLSHPRYGDLTDGFWRVDPVAPPVSSEEMARIVEAATDFNEELLETIVAQERAGWGREAIITVADGAATRIRAAKGKVLAQADKERADADRLAEAEREREQQERVELERRAEEAEARAAAAEAARVEAENAAKVATTPDPPAEPAAEKPAAKAKGTGK